LEIAVFNLRVFFGERAVMNTETENKKAVTGEGTASRVKIGIEQPNGESFCARVNDILRYNARFVKNGVYTPDQFKEQGESIREAIKRALDNADLYLRIDDKIVSTQ
jgi:hypothetical protein